MLLCCAMRVVHLAALASRLAVSPNSLNVHLESQWRHHRCLNHGHSNWHVSYLRSSQETFCKEERNFPRKVTTPAQALHLGVDLRLADDENGQPPRASCYVHVPNECDEESRFLVRSSLLDVRDVS